MSEKPKDYTQLSPEGLDMHIRSQMRGEMGGGFQPAHREFDALWLMKTPELSHTSLNWIESRKEWRVSWIKRLPMGSFTDEDVCDVDVCRALCIAWLVRHDLLPLGVDDWVKP